MLFYRIFPAVVAGCAVLMDLQREKVDNGWLLFCTLLSLFTQLWERDAGNFITWICGLLFPVLLLGVLFVFRMLGAGDIKLLSVIGSLIGPVKILKCISYSFLIGAVISAAIMISNGIICQRILYFLHYIHAYFETGKREPYYKCGMPLENFHFTVPIFFSALLYAGGVY
ncbi:prepilin peptidase [Blautia sp. HCP3S3_H10_1]|uniref:prepilin peptidase n=1 Tax=unclassified Blautia TaxID=2648079 RepID=UPI003F9027C7|nr:prepilin peptidase [Clostridia bacterium]